MSSNRMFKNPSAVSKERVEHIFASGEPERVAECLLALASSEPDTAYVWDTLCRFAKHTAPGIRGIAILCIGHMPRIHGEIPLDWAPAVLEQALCDPDEVVRGHAVSAKDDVEMFVARRE